jgi:hypothetical protein
MKAHVNAPKSHSTGRRLFSKVRFRSALLASLSLAGSMSVSLAGALLSASAHAYPEAPMIELGATVGAAAPFALETPHWLGPSAPGGAWLGNVGFALGADGRLNLSLMDAQGEFIAMGTDWTDPQLQVRAAGGILMLRLHELLYRRGPQSGEELRINAGLGWNFALPRSLGNLTATLGAMYLDWRRAYATQSRQEWGGFVGGSLFLRVWRIQNEFRIAVYGIPHPGDLSPTSIATTGTSGIVRSWDFGVTASNRLYVEVLKLNVMTLGPDLRAQVEQLPDGTEWMGLVGVSGRFGF